MNIWILISHSSNFISPYFHRSEKMNAQGGNPRAMFWIYDNRTKDGTCAIMDYSEGMMEGCGKLLFRKLWLLDVSHIKFLTEVVSITGLLRIGMICKVVNSLSRKSRMSLSSHKGKGKRMANRLE